MHHSASINYENGPDFVDSIVKRIFCDKKYCIALDQYLTEVCWCRFSWCRFSWLLVSVILDNKFVYFSAKNKVKPDISLKIDGEIIAEVTSSNFLGVIIDDKLNWKDHVSFVCRKVARGLGVIIKARKVLRNESLKNLYYSFIYPYLIYCNQVWGSACKSNIEPLFILQKRP